jgi:enamine deaminase RidA (YjgF/YER057c/UK114 family)
LSGTASIDNEGQVMYEGDVRRQTERMWLNCDKLYAEGGASIDADVQVMIVYLRDIADYQVVSQLYEKRFPQVPKVILLAPVCRPGWLIEMESIASVKNKSQWKLF